MGSRIDRKREFVRRYGVNKAGLVDLPVKISNVRVERVFAEGMGECGRCFPHGFETSNASSKKNRRSWKHYRKTQYRVKK